MQHYSSIDYWTAGWTYPRERLRTPFPRRPRRASLALFPLVPLPDLTFAAAPRGTGWIASPRGTTWLAAPRGTDWLAAARGEVFQAPARGTVFVPEPDR